MSKLEPKKRAVPQFEQQKPVERENRSKHVHLQWKPSFYDRVEKFAAEHGASVNETVLVALESAFDLTEG